LLDATEDHLEKLHVLIVDDDSGMLDTLDLTLRAIGVRQITRASTGSEALSVIRSGGRTVDCILCDYMMPKGTGLQLLQAIRTGKVKFCRPDASFILVTASAQQTTVKAAAELDVSGYLVKPVTPAKLKAAILLARTKAIKVDIAKYEKVSVL
jgi:two-component system chemotaxis response regulator CheY